MCFFLSTSVWGEIFQRQQFIQSSSFNCKQSKTFRFVYSTSKEDELNLFQGNLIQDQGKKKKKFTWAKQQCFCFYCSLLIYFQKYLISCVHNYLNPSKIIISLALSFLSALNTPPASQAWQQANKWRMGLLEWADPTWIPTLEQPLQDGSASYTRPAPQSQWSLGTA